MSERREEVVEAVRQWFAFVADDLTSAWHCMSGDPPVPSSVCYHSHQAVEKALKAYLVWLGEKSPARTHDLRALAARLVELGAEDLATEPLRILNRYSTAVRYPGEPIRPSLEEASRAVGLAEKLVDHVRGAVFSPSGADEPGEK